MSNPLFLRFAKDEISTLRLIGAPRQVYRKMMRDLQGNVTVPLCKPDEIGTDGRPAFMRYAIKVIDRKDNTVKVMEFPNAVGKQIMNFVNDVMKRRRRHGRKNQFNPGSLGYGAEIRVLRSGHGMTTTYNVWAKGHLLRKADKQLLEEQPLDLDVVYDIETYPLKPLDNPIVSPTIPSLSSLR